MHLKLLSIRRWKISRAIFKFSINSTLLEKRLCSMNEKKKERKKERNEASFLRIIIWSHPRPQQWRSIIRNGRRVAVPCWKRLGEANGNLAGEENTHRGGAASYFKGFHDNSAFPARALLSPFASLRVPVRFPPHILGQHWSNYDLRPLCQSNWNKLSFLGDCNHVSVVAYVK